MVDPRKRPMKRARAAKVSLVLVSLSGAGSGDLGRRGGPVQVLEMVYSALVDGIFLALTW